MIGHHIYIYIFDLLSYLANVIVLDDDIYIFFIG